MKCFLESLLIMLLISYPICRQEMILKSPGPDEVVIGNPQVSVDSESIYVDYDLYLGTNVVSCNVQLQISFNRDKKFQEIKDGIGGDISHIESSGHKRIVLPLKIYEKKLSRNPFSFSLVVEDKILFSPEEMSLQLLSSAELASASDLSSEATANCYIVSQTGVYSISAVKGNSSQSVGDVSRMEVLWESFGTSVSPSVGDLVQTVCHQSGRIYFKVPEPFKEGNAVIAARDRLGKILWSWHIWLTDCPQEHVYNNYVGTLMDRNLGAISANPGDVGALGLLYQRGRKDPFLGSANIAYSVEAKSTGNFACEKLDKKTDAVAYTIENPTVFINKPKDNILFLGWGGENKTIYDPCPAGWRVPRMGVQGVWSDMCVATFDALPFAWKYDYANKGMDLSDKYCEISPTWYPASGYRKSKDGSLSLVGSIGRYWNLGERQTMDDLNAYFKCFFVSYLCDFYNLGCGRSVRCMKD